MNETPRISPAYWLLRAIFLMALLGSTAVLYASPQTHSQPMPTDGAQNPEDLLCRLGVNAVDTQTIGSLPDLGAGWYMNFTANANPARPEGMEYLPVIRFSPTSNAPGYTYSPHGAALQQTIANNPGAKWLISNEPDSIWQDNLESQVYARAYHELYHLIKTADPNAKIIAGSIIQATPVRLLYLDRILTSYYDQFHTPLPADGWSIHNYILNEENCDVDPGEPGCWGADIPPDFREPDDPDRVLYGEVWGLRDTDRLDIFTERIVRFRQWMAARGYKGLPLYLTEYGVLMPPDFADEDGRYFTLERVNTFMNATYDYMLTATDPNLGDPHDGYRLVQQWAWYSTTDVTYNGVLFDPLTFQPTLIGANFAEYTAVLPREIDLYPTSPNASGYSALSQGEPVTVTLQARVANSGNLTQPVTATVRFYDGPPPPGGGTELGPAQNVHLSGCGQFQLLTLTWPNVPPGVYDVYVQVLPDASVTDNNEANNVAQGRVVVGTHHTFLPTIQRLHLPPGS